jgi:RNA 2',3'-cyclic 3'-phosphodiesterase
MGADTHRLFFALWPDTRTRDALGRAASVLRAGHPEVRGRWVGADRYHVTLHFLGGQAGAFPEALARSAREVAAALAPAAPFDLRIDVAGSFRGRGAPWWLGTARMPEALRALWHGLGEALQRAGLPRDERADFTPHVTVLRDPPRGLPATELGPASLDWPVATFALVHSGTAGYAVIDTWPLRAA